MRVHWAEDSIVLIITKVEDPEELDTRFSKFAPSPFDDTDTARKSLPDKLEGAEDFLQLLNKVKEAVAEMPGKLVRTESSVGTAIRLFSFGSLDRVLDAAHLLSPMYHGVNTLYKDPSDGFFVLALTQSSHTKSDFSKICNMLTEYGILEKSTPASLAYLEEHCETIYTQTAIQHLAKL